MAPDHRENDLGTADREVIPEDNLLPTSKPHGLPADPLASRSHRRGHRLHGRPISLAPKTGTRIVPRTPMHRWRPLERVSTTQVNIKNTVNGAEKEFIQEQTVNTEVRFNVINVTDLVIK